MIFFARLESGMSEEARRGEKSDTLRPESVAGRQQVESKECGRVVALEALASSARLAPVLARWWRNSLSPPPPLLATSDASKDDAVWHRNRLLGE